MEVGWFVKHDMFPEDIYEITDIRLNRNDDIQSIEALSLSDRQVVEFGILDLVSRVNRDGDPWVEVPVELEPVVPRPYQVGDRVRFTNACRHEWWFGPHAQHKEGVISSVGRDGLYSMLVTIDDGGWGGGVSEQHVELILDAEAVEARPEQRQEKATIERFVIIFHNPNLNKISTEIKANERAAQEFVRSLGRYTTVLKTTKVKFEIPLDGLPEGVRW